MDGVYYVYAQLAYDPQQGQPTSGFYIYHDGVVIGRVYSHNDSPQSEDITQYGGFIRTLLKGDRLSVQLSPTAHYNFFSPDTVFRCFRV